MQNHNIQTVDINHDLKTLAQGVNINSPLSIIEFGDNAAKKTAFYADRLLEQARADDFSNIGEQLSDIVLKIREFNYSSLENNWGRTPFIGGILKKLAKTKDKALIKYDSVKSQIEEIIRNVAKTTNDLEQRSKDFQQMYEGMKIEYQSLEDHINALEIVFTRIKDEIDVVKGNANNNIDLLSAEKIASLNNIYNQLEKRSADLKVMQHAALQSMPMLRIVQGNNLALIDKFHTISNLTLPAWKRSFLMALSLEEQDKASKLSKTIDDATNDLLKKNADLLYKNGIAIAKSNQQPIIEIETLSHVNQTIIKTLEDIKTIHDNTRVNRHQVLGKISILRDEMLRNYQNLSNQKHMINEIGLK